MSSSSGVSSSSIGVSSSGVSSGGVSSSSVSSRGGVSSGGGECKAQCAEFDGQSRTGGEREYGGDVVGGECEVGATDRKDEGLPRGTEGGG